MTKSIFSEASLRLAAGVGIATISSFLAPSFVWAQTTQGQTVTSGSITTLELPRKSDYWVTATRQLGGAIILDGYAPDDATRKILAAHPKADAQWLQLGSGASQQYRPAVDLGLSILDRLLEGRFALRDNVLTITGIANSQADYLAIAKSLAAGAPDGLVLARAEVLPPKVEKYEWTAAKSSTGKISLTGMVPDPAIRAAILQSAGNVNPENLIYASGNPDDFLSSAQIGLELLDQANEGKVAFDGKGWTFTGTASAEDKKKIEARFAQGNLAASGWSMALAQSDTPTASESVAVNPDYAFSAVKGGSGEIIFSGQIPADPALKFFKAITGGNTDAVSIVPGAPDDFIMFAEAGVRALMLLEEGSLGFAKGEWSLAGVATDPGAKDSAIAALDASSASAWTPDISLPAQSAQTLALDATTVPKEALEEEPLPSGLAACQTQLAELSARNEILFRPGVAVIAPESAPALDELATDLAACPDAKVQIEGHTDADGDDQLNLALSVARAEAVIGALLERGVAAERLYALGYGETSPISDNDTPEGKRLNRRIVVKVSSEF